MKGIIFSCNGIEVLENGFSLHALPFSILYVSQRRQNALNFIMMARKNDVKMLGTQ